MSRSGIVASVMLLTVTSWASAQELPAPQALKVVRPDDFPSCGGRLLGGFEQMHPYEGSPMSAEGWKAFRFLAEAGAAAGCVKVFLKGLSGDRTADEVGVAVYEDEGGAVGPLKAWGHVRRYDWTVRGTWDYHAFGLDNLPGGAALVAGNHYWLSFMTSGGENVLIERGRKVVPGCSAPRVGARTAVVSVPPPPSAYDVGLNPGCYGWSVW